MQINFNYKGKIVNYDKKRNRQSGRQKNKSTWEEQYKSLMDEINTLIEQGVLPPVDSKLPEVNKEQLPKPFAKQPILG